MELNDILLEIYPLPRSSSDRLTEKTEIVTFPKYAPIIDTMTVDKNIYFLKQGLVRAFVYANGKEITFWIGAEGSIVLSMESYINSRPGYETIEAIEDTTLYRIGIKTLERLYNEDIHMANWGRKFAEREILRAEKCLIPQLYTTATRRYEEFIRHHPDLLNRIPLEHLASYLGVTPVSLSRIRANIAKGKSR